MAASPKGSELESEFAEAVRAGRTLVAARLAWRLGRRDQSAQLFEQVGAFLDAAAAYVDAGQEAEALRCALEVSSSDPSYPAAARLAIELSEPRGAVSHDVEQFLETYLAATLVSPDDIEAVFTLAQLYEASDYLAHAGALYRQVAAVQPNHPASERLDVVEARASQFATSEVLVSQRDLRALRQRVRAEVGASADAEQGAENGRVLASRYRLEGLLGTGAYASVYRALDLSLNARVALKLVHSSRSDATAQARFKREVSLARRLTHANIVRIHDLGQHENRLFFTMELLDGDNLRSCMSLGRHDAAARRQLVVQALEGLDYAHQTGVIHRDIKPENLFVTRDGTLKIADFGMAKAPNDANVTLPGVMGGTPHYMSPEQITDLRSADHRSDLYALGVVAYELFTGARPFDADGLSELLVLHLRHTPTPMRKLRPELPEALDDIVLKLLAKTPAERFQTALEARDALARVPT